MNRVIKFRVWHKGMNKMYPSERIMLTFRDGLQIATTDKNNIESHGYIERKSDVVELMQFTGLHDKNGKEIYAGDILRGISEDVTNPSDRLKIKDKYLISPVFFDKNHACFDTSFQTDLGYICHLVVVIGNIYENPELLDN